MDIKREVIVSNGEDCELYLIEHNGKTCQFLRSAQNPGPAEWFAHHVAYALSGVSEIEAELREKLR